MAVASLAPVRAPRSRRASLALALCASLVVLACLASLAIGPVTIAPGRIIDILVAALAGERASGAALREAVIVLDVRLPRTLLGLLVGGGIALAGAVTQGIFRNPLADPGLIGISNGAALAAAAWIVAGSHLALYLPPALADVGLPLMAFGGALIGTVTLYAISTREGRTSVVTMLFAGIAIAALAAAGTGLLVFAASDQQLRDFTFWSFGSLSGATWPKVVAALPFMALLALICTRLARALDALALGEAEAFHVGIDVQRAKWLAILGIAAGAGASVAVAGVIGFVGLVVPHLIRLVVGPSHRLLLPCAALLGGALLLGADVVARTVVSPAELPLGIVTAGVGAPFFLWLLLRRRAALMG
ncbi:FecCD family ABC transporter permease [Ancylobacter sp. IITR112]|uniref:FecCD family ABC transporter permease n=1 Tax=Ancylobacter sp. IITR112 TaxID=3138073 RepID=UPI00352A5464